MVLLVSNPFRQQRPHALNCTDDESPGTPDLASTGHGQEPSIQIGEEYSQNGYIAHPFTQENSTLLEQRGGMQNRPRGGLHIKVCFIFWLLFFCFSMKLYANCTDT